MTCESPTCGHVWEVTPAHVIRILTRRDERGVWESVQCPKCGRVQAVLRPIGRENGD